MLRSQSIKSSTAAAAATAAAAIVAIVAIDSSSSSSSSPLLLTVSDGAFYQCPFIGCRFNWGQVVPTSSSSSSSCCVLSIGQLQIETAENQFQVAD